MAETKIKKTTSVKAKAAVAAVKKPAVKAQAKVVAKPVVKAEKPVAAKEVKVEAKLNTPAKSQKADISVSVYGADGKTAGKIALPGEIFGAKINPTLMAQAVRVYMATQRRGMASTKTRSEVNGTTKKIYRQKGTGRARHGAAKAPLFVGGGITFGPRPHDFGLTLPKKMKKAALFSALTSKLQENNVKVLDGAALSGKTREMVTTLKSLELTSKKGTANKVMVVVDGEGKLVAQGARNIMGTTIQNVSNLTTYEILNSKSLLFTKGSIETLKKTFLKGDK